MGGNELSLFEGTENWYTIEELSELSGLEKSTLTKGNSPLNSIDFGIDLKIESKTVNIGGHKNVKKYSEKVLQALKKYQHRNSTPNAVIKKEDYIKSHSEWYTLKQLSSFTGLGKDRLNQLLPELCNQLQDSFKLGGYHNTQKIYSEKVLQALKKYQLRNSTSNAVKNKGAVISGNISVIENATVKQTISTLLNNPNTLHLLLTESLARSEQLGIENKYLKEVIEEQRPKVEVYDSICESVTLQDLQTVATTIKLKNIFKVLEADKVLEVKFTDDGQKYYKPLAQYTNYLVLKNGRAWTDQNGIKHIRPRVFVTGKGLTWLTKKYSEECEL